MILNKNNNILILREIYPEEFSPIDVITSVHRELQNNKINQTVYSQIPRKFTHIDLWPKSSNLKCWNCDRVFKDIPKPCIIGGEKINGMDSYDNIGNFCCFNCVAAYIDKELPIEQRWDALHFLNIMYYKFTGQHREKILPAPDKREMKEYCGDNGLTLRQYQEKIDKLNEEYDLSYYKLNHYKTDEL